MKPVSPKKEESFKASELGGNTETKAWAEIRWAPLPVIRGVTTPLSRVITPVTHLFSATYRGPITSFITIVGAHLEGVFHHSFSNVVNFDFQWNFGYIFEKKHLSPSAEDPRTFSHNQVLNNGWVTRVTLSVSAAAVASAAVVKTKSARPKPRSKGPKKGTVEAGESTEKLAENDDFLSRKKECVKIADYPSFHVV